MFSSPQDGHDGVCVRRRSSELTNPTEPAAIGLGEGPSHCLLDAPFVCSLPHAQRDDTYEAGMIFMLAWGLGGEPVDILSALRDVGCAEVRLPVGSRPLLARRTSVDTDK